MASTRVSTGSPTPSLASNSIIETTSSPTTPTVPPSISSPPYSPRSTNSFSPFGLDGSGVVIEEEVLAYLSSSAELVRSTHLRLTHSISERSLRIIRSSFGAPSHPGVAYAALAPRTSLQSLYRRVDGEAKLDARMEEERCTNQKLKTKKMQKKNSLPTVPFPRYALNQKNGMAL